MAIVHNSDKWVTLDGTPLVVFIPKDDDAFRTSSHYCEFVVETPDGNWLFNRQLTPDEADRILAEQCGALLEQRGALTIKPQNS